MYHCGMKQMEERHVANQVDLMVWSNRLDLLALSNYKGEIQIHRLHWQKVWNLSPPRENVTVRCMAWRPDGKALSIGYSCGSVFIIDIEDKEVLDKYELEHEALEEFDESKHYGITCIAWAARVGALESATEYNFYDDASIFLQKPPSTSSNFKNQGTEDNVKFCKEIQEPTQLNMLLIGYGSGSIYMSIFGRYHYGTICLAQVTKDECGEYSIVDINLSDDFSVMQVVYLDRVTKHIFLSLINTSVLSAYAEEIFVVANRHGQIMQLITYLDQTMTSITEAWEHILLEMDTKMAYYATFVPEGGVSADLLELLMLGVPSDELEIFLLQELTAKGLKKFGSSVELSYSTIQKLVLRQLNIVGQHLTYFLSELRGLTRIPDRYKILGLEETTVTEAIRACCAFLNKSLELQQVIDVSMRNYKAFFRWLFVVIVRLLDEQTPSEIVKINQQELGHIAEFLYNFDNVQGENHVGTPDKPVKFNLERLGQYLQDQELTKIPDDDDSPWQKFLKDNSCLLKDNDTIFSMSEFKKFSLIQQQKFLKNAISNVFDFSKKDFSKHFSVLYNIKCHENQVGDENNLRISQIFDANQQQFMMTFVDPINKHDICFVSTILKEKSCSSTAVKYSFSGNLLKGGNIEQLNYQQNMVVLDLQFYSPDYMSVLLEHPENHENSVFIQLPLKIALENAPDFNIKSKSFVFSEKSLAKDLSLLLLDQDVYKVLDKMHGYRIAVSGGRKVAVVLSRTCRKVRVFEMEIDGEEEEEILDITQRSNNSTCASDQQNITNEDLTI
ncbi:hypothetical protein evm_009615 [Chilo suppressalis]|nr:hypothetical protein evm_009615 [Chilo suppressalis]